MLRIFSALLALGLVSQAVYSLSDNRIKTERLKSFFVLNSLILAFAFLSIMIKTAHVGLSMIKHLMFDIFTITFLTIILIFDFYIIDRLLAASRDVKILIHQHIIFVFIFLILSLVYMTLYSETTNRIELMEMIEEAK